MQVLILEEDANAEFIVFDFSFDEEIAHSNNNCYMYLENLIEL